MFTKKPDENLSDSLCIVGGGAAGLMCGCIAAESGAKVVIFEQNRSEKTLASEKAFDNAYLGKKLLITGKGRCNLTNACTREVFMKNIPRNAKFLFGAYSAFPPEKVMEYFESHGLSLKVERGERVFPTSDRALDVLRTLKDILSRSGVTFIRTKITDLRRDGEVFFLVGEDGTIYRTENAVLATGGLSYPVTGSTGDGYRFAENLGHTVEKPVPSLVPLVSGDAFCKRLQGLSLRNVTLTLKNTAGKTVYSELGELLFTHFGLSGPLVLSASAHMEKIPSDYSLSIDLKPALDEGTLDHRIVSDFSKNPNRAYKNALSELLPSKLIPVFAERSGIAGDRQVNGITKTERAVIVRLLKNFTVSIADFRPINEAIITRGGVSVKEVNPSTMESKRISGLYFIGEILDTDGYTGGFNLQIAFSTAYLAAKAAVMRLQNQNTEK